MPKASFQFFFILLLSFYYLHNTQAKEPEVPKTSTTCVIKLIGKNRQSNTKQDDKLSLPSESIEPRAEALDDYSITCTGDNLPIEIHVLPKIKEILEKKSKGVKFISSSSSASIKTTSSPDPIKNALKFGEDAADGYLHFKDLKNITIENSIFENLEGGSLAPIVFEGCAVVLNNCSIKDNSMSRNGGIYAANSLIFIYNSIFSGNKAIHNGAMTADVNSQLGVYNTVFENNEGGLSDESLSSFDSGAIFINQNTISVFDKCEFNNNLCQGNGGGALTALKRSLANFTNCIIKENEGISGAISLTDTCSTVIKKSQVIGNMAKFESATITAIITSGILLIDSVIKGNFGFSGAVLISDNSEVIAERCHFESNTGFVYGGAVSSKKGGKVFTFKCTFLKNSGDFGGAIYQDFSIQTIIKETTFSQNLANEGGGALFQKDCQDTLIKKSKFSSNVAALSPGGAIMQVGCGTVYSVSELKQSVMECDKNPNRKCDYITIKECIFSGNKVKGETGIGSAIFQERCEVLDFEDTTFSNIQKDTATVYQSHCIKRKFSDVTGIDESKHVRLSKCPNETSKRNL